MSRPESVDALEEAIAILRMCWSGERSVSFDGEHYRMRGAKFGPLPAHDIGIWLGIAELGALHADHGFDAFLLWSEGDMAEQIARLAAGVAPALRSGSGTRG